MEKTDNSILEMGEYSSASIDIYNYRELVTEYFGGDVDDEYAYYIYCNDRLIKKIAYSHNTKCSWWLEEEGVYKVQIYIKHNDGSKKAVYTDCIEYNKRNVLRETITEKNFFQKVLFIIKEIVSNWSMMTRVALFDYRLRNMDSYLGKIWEILTPLIQIGTYWFVFGIGMRQGRDMDGYPYLLWMLSGLIPWFCISTAITKGSNSIFLKSATITKLRYPIATVPIGTILTEMIGFMYTLIILEVVFLFFGYLPNWGYLNLIYYTAYMFAFLASLALVTSVFTMVARDFQKLLTNLIRLLFYLTPILWDMSKMPVIYQKIVGVSPIYYVVKGFRDSMLYNVPFYAFPKDIIVNWVTVIVLLLFGCYLQEKFRNRFRDLI